MLPVPFHSVLGLSRKKWKNFHDFYLFFSSRCCCSVPCHAAADAGGPAEGGCGCLRPALPACLLCLSGAVLKKGVKSEVPGPLREEVASFGLRL
jgi:hypothetical protein